MFDARIGGAVKLPSTDTPSWLQPPEEAEGLNRYLQVLRERWRLIAGMVAVALAAAAWSLATSDSVYEAEADLLIAPVSSDDPALSGLPLLRDSADPLRDVETAARLVHSIDVAERALESLGVDRSARDLLEDVSAEPVAESNVVAVTAEADSPAAAADLANAFAAAAVEERTVELHDQIATTLPVLRERLQGATGLDAEATAELIGRFESLAAAPDPTIRAESEALPPESAVSPRPMLTIAGALLAGLILGTVGAFGLQAVDPRLRREEQIRRLYRLPILARVPREPGGERKRGALAPGKISPRTAESYRTLRSTVIAVKRRRAASEAVLITGSSPSEGKTSTAVNLAVSLALAGDRTILIEADLRRPAIGTALGVQAEQGIVSVLLENVALEDALVSSERFGPNLEFLLADHEGGWIAELFSLPAAQRLVDDARKLAEYVIIDSPPLTAVIDTMPLAVKADDVMVVCRLEHTRLDKLHHLAELLADHDITPQGFVVVGSQDAADREYYYQTPGGLPDANRMSAGGGAEALARFR